MRRLDRRRWPGLSLFICFCLVLTGLVAALPGQAAAKVVPRADGAADIDLAQTAADGAAGSLADLDAGLDSPSPPVWMFLLGAAILAGIGAALLL